MTESVFQIQQEQADAQWLLERCGERIEQWEPLVHAWVRLGFESALEQLGQGSREKAEQPLFGVPVGVKDIIDVAGWPTLLGVNVPDARPATCDAVVVERLKRAGALLLGKTVTTPYACFDPPPTRNPWNLQRTPGGSSSGSAAAVATGMCVLALGTQTGGSIIRPAAYCGVVGFKPSFGRIDLSGVFPLAPSLDHLGVLTARVSDAAFAFFVLADDGLFGSGRLWQPAETTNSHASKTSSERFWEWWKRFTARKQLCELTTSTGKPLTLGVLDDERWLTKVSSEARQAVETFAARLQAAGALLRRVQAPLDLESMLAVHRVIMSFEAARVHAERIAKHPERYPSKITAFLKEGSLVRPAEYARALKQRDAFRQEWNEWLQEFDALLLPATLGPAPDRSTTGDPRLNSPWSLLGVPELTLPVGSSEEGLPLGAQLVGAAGADVHLLSVGVKIERCWADR